MALTAWASACSNTPPAATGGLELIIATDGLSAPIDFDDIRLEVSQQSDGGSWNKLWDRDYVVPSQEATLPTTFAVVAGSGAEQEVLISVTAFKGGSSGEPVVQRVAQVQAPTDRVAALWLVLAAVCRGQVTVAGAEGEPVSTCPIAGQSCQPSTGGCGSSVISDPGGLPTYVPGESLDAAPEGAVVVLNGDASGARAPGGTDATLARDSTVDAAETGSSDGEAAATDATPASDSKSDAAESGLSDGWDAEAGTVAVLALAAGWDQVDTGFTCALLSGGTVRCWGSNIYGELGDGTANVDGGTNSATPVKVSNLTGVIAIAAGGRHACAIATGGTVQCWGDNTFGELGNRTTTNSSVPVAVSGLRGATALAAGIDFTCALLSDHTVQCWGIDASGTLGTTAGLATCTSAGPVTSGSYGCSMTPVAVPTQTGVIALSSNRDHSCALSAGGAVQCWGGNLFGELGNGTTTSSSAPVAVSGLNGATAVASGNLHTCALVSGGAVQCWGWNYAGQLGDGTTSGPATCNSSPPQPCSTTPVAVSNLSAAVAVAAGGDESCAVLPGGIVQCWGYTLFGNGTTNYFSTPVVIAGLSGVTAVAAGRLHTCALLSDASVRCWGDNSYGQLGNGTTISSPTLVAVTW